MADSLPPSGGTLRLDKFLWFARLAGTRSAAQAMVEEGHIHMNGRRIERSHAAIRPGDILTIPHGHGVRVLRVVELPRRRGPAPEACAHYEEIMPGA